KLAFAALVTVADVMEMTGISAGDNDGLICEAASLTNELVSQFSLNLGFTHSGAAKSKHALKAIGCDFAGSANQLQFGLRLDGTQPVKQRGKPLIIMQRIFCDRLRDKSGVTALHFNHRALVLVAVQKHMRTLAHQAMKQARKFR